jgi:AraC-like DNA-binding protein
MMRPRLLSDRALGSAARLRRWSFGDGRPVDAPACDHPVVEVAWAAHGQAVYEIGHRTIELTATSPLVVPDGVRHATRFMPGLRASALHVERAFVDAIAEEHGLERELALGPLPSSDRLERLASLLEDEAASPGPLTDLAEASVTHAIAIEILRHAPEARSGPIDVRVRRAKARIDADPRAHLSLADLAKTATMSRYHFCRVFTREVGRSPYRYALGARLALVRRLLETRRANVTEAAMEAGFSDLSRFRRAFHAVFGVSPSQLLASARAARADRVARA